MANKDHPPEESRQSTGPSPNGATDAGNRTEVSHESRELNEKTGLPAELLAAEKLEGGVHSALRALIGTVRTSAQATEAIDAKSFGASFPGLHAILNMLGITKLLPSTENIETSEFADRLGMFALILSSFRGHAYEHDPSHLIALSDPDGVSRHSMILIDGLLLDCEVKAVDKKYIKRQLDIRLLPAAGDTLDDDEHLLCSIECFTFTEPNAGQRNCIIEKGPGKGEYRRYDIATMGDIMTATGEWRPAHIPTRATMAMLDALEEKMVAMMEADTLKEETLHRKTQTSEKHPTPADQSPVAPSEAVDPLLSVRHIVEKALRKLEPPLATSEHPYDDADVRAAFGVIERRRSLAGYALHAVRSLLGLRPTVTHSDTPDTLEEWKEELHKRCVMAAYRFDVKTLQSTGDFKDFQRARQRIAAATDDGRITREAGKNLEVVMQKAWDSTLSSLLAGLKSAG